MDRLVVVSDAQIHYHDAQAIAAVNKFLVNFQPTTFVMNGDMIDCTALSKFKLTLAERQTLGLQRDILRDTLENWRNLMPLAQMVYVLGNHEERLATYMRDNAPELDFLLDDELSFEKFANLDTLDIELVAPYGEAFDWHGLTIIHGERILQNTAKANLLYEGSSGVSGHTHRLSSYYKTDRSGDHVWYESGCLCKRRGADSPPPSHPGVHDWQQGFIAGYAWGGQRWTVYQVPIVEHTFAWEGQVYRA